MGRPRATTLADIIVKVVYRLEADSALSKSGCHEKFPCLPPFFRSVTHFENQNIKDLCIYEHTVNINKPSPNMPLVHCDFPTSPQALFAVDGTNRLVNIDVTLSISKSVTSHNIPITHGL